jgi:uncharacterized protein YaeQ
MSFVEAFYSFTVELAVPDRNLYTKVRLKVPRHPHESLHFLYARVIAFLHAYREGLALGKGLFEPKDPTLSHTDITGVLLFWGEVGCPAEEKIDRVVRRRPPPEIRVYFYAPEQSLEFCRYLRGSTTNWVAPIAFFEIDPHLLEALIPLERSSSRWSANFVDTSLYLTIDEHDLAGEVRPLDIWELYQQSLANPAIEKY